MKKGLAFLLSVVLLLSCVSAYALQLPQEAEDFLFRSSNVCFDAGLSIASLLPYGSETLAELNALLPHLRLSADLTDSSAELAVLVDGESCVSMTETQGDRQSILTSPQLPNRTLTSSGSALSAFFPTEECAETEDEEDHSFNLYEAITQAKQACPALEEALKPYAESKSANYTIKNVGKAKWVHLARLTKDQSAEIYEPLCNILFSGLSESYQSTLKGMTFLKALTVAVYKDAENGNVMAVYIKGNVKHPNGKSYQLNYLFAFSDKATSYKLELGSGKKGGIKASGLLKGSLTESKYETDGSSSAEFRSADGKTTRKFQENIQLSGTYQKDTAGLSGSVQTTLTVSGDDKSTESSEYTLNLTHQSSVLTGTVAVKQSRDDNSICELTLTFTEPENTDKRQEEAEAEVPKETEIKEENSSVTIVILDSTEETNEDEPDESDSSENVSEYQVGAAPVGITSYSAPTAEQTVDLDSLSSEERTVLQNELYQNAASELLLMIFTKVPQSDLTLFSDGANAQAFTNLVNNLQGNP